MCLQLYKSSVWYVEHHVKGLCRISLISAILLGPNDWFLNEVSLLAGKNTPLPLNRLFHAEWMSDEWVSIYCNIQIHLTVTAFKCELENEAHALHSNSIFDHDAVKLTLTAFFSHLTFKTWKDLQNCCRYYLFSDSTLKYRTKHITLKQNAIFCQTLKRVQWYFWPLAELWSSASTSYLHSADPHEFACLF